MRTYYVYIMESRSRVLYTGVTNDLARRVDEHKRSLTPGFTSRYHITRLVYFEEFGDVRDAIAREKQLKGWVRSRKTRYARDAKDLLDLSPGPEPKALDATASDPSSPPPGTAGDTGRTPPPPGGRPE